MALTRVIFKDNTLVVFVLLIAAPFLTRNSSESKTASSVYELWPFAAVPLTD